MTRVLRSGVDPLSLTDDDDLDRCVCCELPIPPLTGVAYGAGIAHPVCVGLCPLCGQRERPTPLGKFTEYRGVTGHTGCLADLADDDADAYLSLVSS